MKNDEERQGKLIEQKNRTVVVAFTSRSNNPSSRYYHSYCKHMLIKHKPWCGQVFNLWDGPIVDPSTGQTTDEE